LIVNYKLYPFGSVTPGRSFTSESYRYGFNGQEKDDEVAGTGNINTAMYWEYDTRLGRRWNLDPKSQANMSDYNCFGNSPIHFFDLFGDEFDPKSQKKVDKVKSKIAERQTQVDIQLADVSTRIDDLMHRDALSKSEVKELSTLKTMASDLNMQKNELNAASAEIATLEITKQKYTIKTGLFLGGGGKSTYNTKKDVFVIRLGLGANESTLGHELKHGYEFLSGEISFTENGRNPGYLTTIGDEVNAYKRQYAIDPERVSSNMLNVNTSNNITRGKVRGLSHHYKHLPAGERNLDNASDKAKAQKKGDIFVSDDNKVPR
jgi:hypothetical protein